jgi:hypothetical protein
MEVELRKIQAQRPELGTLVPVAAHAAHVHLGDGGGSSGGEAEEGGSGGRLAAGSRESQRLLPVVHDGHPVAAQHRMAGKGGGTAAGAADLESHAKL